MFTGIVEEIGEVAELNRHDSTGGTCLTISLTASSPLLSDCHIGDSIAVNGVCLTITSFSPTAFTVGLAPETLRLTNLGRLSPASRVNLERAVRADTRMGGHFVQGHIDGVCLVARRVPDGNALTMRFALPALGGEGWPGPPLLRYIVRKGYVALDGTSLTVTAVNDAEGWWEVTMISYTQEKVVLAGKQVGEEVNLEVDITAKYVEKSLAGYLGGPYDSAGGGGGAGMLEMVERMVAQGFGSKAA